MAQSETTNPETTFNCNVKATPPVCFKVKQVPVDFLQPEISINTFIEMIDKIENNRGTPEKKKLTESIMKLFQQLTMKWQFISNQ